MIHLFLVMTQYLKLTNSGTKKKYILVTFNSICTRCWYHYPVCKTCKLCDENNGK